MSKLFSLTKVYFLSIIRGKEDKPIKKIGRIFILLLAVFVLVFYSYKFASYSMKGYKLVNLEYILLPEYFAMTSSFLIFSNFKKINGFFFKSNDYEMLCAMPIKRKYIVISKILEVYVSALLISLITMLPAYTVYVNAVSNLDAIFHVMFFASLIFIPCIPVVISVFIGYLISYISTFFKNKERAQFFLSLFAFILGYRLMERATNMTTGEYANFGKIIINFFDKFYPLTKTYKYIVVSYDGFSLLMFIFLNVLSLVGLTFIITKSYDYIHEKMLHVKSSKKTSIKTLKTESKTKILLKKDFKKLFSSFNYLFNTNTGVLIITAMVLLFLFQGNAAGVIKNIAAEGSSYQFAIIFVMFLGFIYPAAVSLSMEGKSFYILRMLPISFKDIIKEKVLFELTLSVIPVILISILIFAGFNYGIVTSIIFVTIYISSAILYALVHLLLDVIFLKLNWVNEVRLCKQSLQVFISIILAVILGITSSSHIKNDFALVIYLIILLLLIASVYTALVTFGNKKYEKTCN